MNALILEDEKPASRRIIKLLGEIDDSIKILAVLDSVESAVEWLSKNSMVEIIFMDIHLADGSSFDILKRTKISCPIIFTTAYNEYAINAFKVNSIDYLLKPIKKEELEAALNKLNNLRHSYALETLDELIKLEGKKYKDRFVIKLGNKIKSILTEHICYFYSKDKLSFICEGEGKNYPIDLSLDKIETLLDPSIFFRVNRQIIANTKAIKEIQTSIKSRIIITLEPPISIEAIISSERSSVFKKWLKKE